MYRYLFVFFSVLAVPAFADHQEFTLKDPTFPGTDLPYAYVAWNCPSRACARPDSFTPKRSDFHGAVAYLNENGVCRSLGYERAVPNSSASHEDSNDSPRVQVDAAGSVNGAVAGRSLSEITCVNKRETRPAETLTPIENPRHPKTGLPFTRAKNGPAFSCGNPIQAASSEDRVCEVLGHQRAAGESSYTQHCSSLEKSMRVTRTWLGRSVEKVVQGRIMESIICVN